MTTAELKIDLNRFILDLEDREILEYISSVFSTLGAGKNGWENVSDAEMHSIEKGVKDASEGKISSREEVRAEILKILQQDRAT